MCQFSILYSYIYILIKAYHFRTGSKEVRHIRLTNKGTTVIRYQWLRCEPNPYLRNLLANPGKMLSLETETEPGAEVPMDLLKPTVPPKCELGRN
jgi:hypothetical protein